MCVLGGGESVCVGGGVRACVRARVCVCVRERERGGGEQSTQFDEK